MQKISFIIILISVFNALMLVYLVFSTTKIKSVNVESYDPYEYVRDTFAYAPTEIMYEERRLKDGIPIDTTNVWRRDISEFE